MSLHDRPKGQGLYAEIFLPANNRRSVLRETQRDGDRMQVRPDPNPIPHVLRPNCHQDGHDPLSANLARQAEAHARENESHKARVDGLVARNRDNLNMWEVERDSFRQEIADLKAKLARFEQFEENGRPKNPCTGAEFVAAMQDAIKPCKTEAEFKEILASLGYEDEEAKP
jgi:hypothetical protein